jgi:GDP-L-fucose synthase
MKEVMNLTGKLVFEATKPDGSPRKLIEITRLTNMECSHKIELKKV